MSNFINDYLSRELNNIYVVSSNSHEDSGAFQTETCNQTVVAKTADERYVEVYSTEYCRFGPNGSRNTTYSETEISEEAYKERSEGKAPIDTAEARAEYAETARLAAKRAAITDQLMETAPVCPLHLGKMRVVDWTNGPFWGCTQFLKKKCKKNKSFTRAQNLLYAEAKSI